MIDHLKEAKGWVGLTGAANDDAQIAIAHALIAICERLDAMLVGVCEGLDTVADRIGPVEQRDPPRTERE